MNNEEKILSMLEGLTTTVGQIQADVGQIQAEQIKTNQRLDMLEQGQAKLEQGQAKLRHDLSELTTLTHDIIRHQNEDYALLQAVDRRLEHLASISRSHEEKFQKIRAL
jgi:uncharacterized phage infection (PIP) family protein YhgE